MLCYRNPNTEEREHGFKENTNNGAPPLPIRENNGIEMQDAPEKIMDSKWKMDPLFSILEILVLGKWKKNGFEMEYGSIIFYSRNPNTGEIPKENNNNNGAPPPLRKIMESTWKMDPIFSAIETLILRKWNMDPKKTIIMAPPPPTPEK